MISLHRSASRIHRSYLQFCMKRVSARTPRLEFTTASPKDKDDPAGEPASLWSRFVGAEPIKRVKSALQALVETPSNGAPESTQPEEPEADAPLHRAESIAEPLQKVSSEPSPSVSAPVAHDAKTLRKAIAKASRINEFQELVRVHGMDMTNDHLLLLLGRFANSRIPDKRLQASRVFVDLTEILLLRLNSFNAHDLVRIFETAHRFEMGNDSILLNGIIEALRMKFNDLSLTEIMQFFEAVQEVPYTSVHMEMVKKVIPVIFETRYRNELDMNDTKHCQKALVFSCRAKLNLQTCASIADAAVDSSPYFSTEQARNLIFFAARNPILLQNSDSMRTIVENCMEILSGSVRKMDKSEIQKMLMCCMKGEIGTKQFFDAFWELAPSWTLPQVGLLIKTCLTRNLYMTVEAAQQVTRMIPGKCHQLTEEDAVYASCFSIAIALNSRDKEPCTVAMLQCQRAATALVEADECMRKLLEDRGSFLNFLINLSYVGVFPESLLQQAFRSDYQEQFGFDDVQKACYLERQLLLHYGEDSPYRVLPRAKKDSQRLLPNRDYLFEATLGAALGGKRFFRSGVTTPMGSAVKYIVAMQADDRAIPLLTEENFFENVPPATKVVAIVICGSRHKNYSLTGLKKASLSITERQLQAQNLCTVVIDRDEFSRMATQDAVAYLWEALSKAYLRGPEYAPRFAPTKVNEEVT